MAYKKAKTKRRVISRVRRKSRSRSVGRAITYQGARVKVGEVSGNLVLGGIILAGLGVAAWKLGLFDGSGGGGGTGGNNTAEQQIVADAKNDLATALQSMALSYPTSQYSGYANTIFQLAVKGTPIAQADQDTIKWDVIQCNNLADILQLIIAFNTRNINTGGWVSVCAVFDKDCTAVSLPTFLNLGLDTAHLAAINEFMADQNINYTF